MSASDRVFTNTGPGSLHQPQPREEVANYEENPWQFMANDKKIIKKIISSRNGANSSIAFYTCYRVRLRNGSIYLTSRDKSDIPGKRGHNPVEIKVSDGRSALI